jgi:hypothetical protein
MISITKDDMLKQNNITSKEMEMGIEMMKFMNPLIPFPVQLYVFFYGLIYSLIVGAIVKNENPQSCN